MRLFLPRRFPVQLWLYGVLLTVAAGCRSASVAYYFRPPAPLPTALRAATPQSTTAPEAAPAAPAASGEALARPPQSVAERRIRLAQPLAKAVAQVAPRFLYKSGAMQAHASQRKLRQAPFSPVRHTSLSPQRPAEVGLGTTVLGVLGLIVLPLSLIGLLVWGGPVWAILAGLSAVAVLVAWLDPFR